MKRVTLMACAVILTLTCGFELNAAEPSPNIVFILLDDFGYGDARCYNPQSKIPTPNIDRLAKEGLRFTDAHAPGPLCHMSRYGLMTGRYPFRIDVSKWPRQPLITAGELTLPRMLRQNGYRTAMVGKWHLGFREQGYDQPLPGGPVDCGFESFFGIRASTDIPPYFYIRDRQAVQPPTKNIAANQTPGWSPIQGAFWRAGGIAPDLNLKDVLPRFTQEALQVLDKHQKNSKSKPLFLYLAYPAPHTPWLPSEQFRGKSQAGLYGDFAMMVDFEVGRILQALDEQRMTKNTIVVLTSDNGPVWYERNVQRYEHDSSGGLRGMKGDAWECGHRMPLLVRWPGKIHAERTSDQLVSFTDFLATFADLLSVRLPGNSAPDSISFLSVLTGGDFERPLRESLVLQSARKLYVVRKGPWKYISGRGSGGFSPMSADDRAKRTPEGQLYHLVNDPGETTNRFDNEPQRVELLKTFLQQEIRKTR